MSKLLKKFSEQNKKLNTNQQRALFEFEEEEDVDYGDEADLPDIDATNISA